MASIRTKSNTGWRNSSAATTSTFDTIRPGPIAPGSSPQKAAPECWVKLCLVANAMRRRKSVSRRRKIGGSRGRCDSRRLPVRWSAVRSSSALHPRQPLSLFAMPQAFRNCSLHAGTCPARAVRSSSGRALDSRLWRRRGSRQGFLLGLRIEPLRWQVAARRTDFHPNGSVRRRPRNPASVSYVRGLACALGSHCRQASPVRRSLGRSSRCRRVAQAEISIPRMKEALAQALREANVAGWQLMSNARLRRFSPCR